MKLAQSLTVRLAVLFALMAGGLLIIMGVLIERSVSLHFDELDSHELATKLTTVERLLSTTTSHHSLDTLSARINEILAGHDNIAILIAIADQQWQYALRAEHLEPMKTHLVTSKQPFLKWSDASGADFIGIATQFSVSLPELSDVNVLVGLDISHHVHFLNTLRLQLGIGIGIATLFAAMLGWMAAHKGLAPMRTIAGTARRLSAHSLGERLSTEEAPSEIQELVQAFNGMLERLEQSFRRLNEFSADIAHELRSPVSNLMTETQVALSRSRSAEEYQEALHSNLEEFERLARMIADMLFLAKADNGMLPKPEQNVALESEVRALFEFYEALAEEKGLTMKLIGKGSVIGDRLMLRRALSNLLSNAIRHAPTEHVITVTIKRVNHQVHLLVSNPGEPIPRDQIPLVFERFHRGDPSRLRQGDGSGLGLSITRSIVEAHQGEIILESDPQQTTFTIRLPAHP
ncbi:heavy metal sensor histidine kinase [Vibrio metschnikovii]|uniref:heavy metal sensor histidine kinase n=1 Tax=Vibrio metschnikovii TaxID=28172 RepID=UPI001C2F81AB|nr:heavy metal sensor histidine kinase [Vibrio metschnikovii]